METFEIDGVGKITHYRDSDWALEDEIMVPVLGHPCFISLENYQNDPAKQEFHAALVNLLKLNHEALEAIQDHVYQYYKDVNDACWVETDAEYLEIGTTSEIWKFVQLGNELYVRRRPFGDKKIYISLDCKCDWEDEHGLLIVFKEGLAVNKIGGYDGHLSNADAYGDPALEGVVYR